MSYFDDSTHNILTLGDPRSVLLSIISKVTSYLFDEMNITLEDKASISREKASILDIGMIAIVDNMY